MKRLIYPVLIGLGLVGCSQSKSSNEQAEVATEMAAEAPGTPVAGRNAPARQAERSVIYEGQLDLEVDDFEQTTTAIDHLLEQHWAYLSTAHETRANGQHRQEMTLKVKPSEFLPLIAALGKLGRITNKDISSADVTADVLAATTTLAAKQKAEAKYQQLLAATTNPAEVRRLGDLARESHLDIADAQAKLQQFGTRSAWATLTLRYSQVLPTPAPSSPMPDFAPRFLEAFYRGWSILLGFIVVLTNLWPLLLLGGIGTWGLRKFQHKKSL
ncbi:DUF4349 domain-containing protein [Hymenobacter sp. BT664]|uniref:DUF4349 domain-containing protein n=1 Tax=Hymenobacter montanus TaxID=2771359 RepID=A0A927BC61_9BACT|nr:DUF4349 domain-containing protein [Hymenobacter montanus]MBD2767761.1 DUF4349 domain-containing protein [Hymenobacter montanus]